MILKIDSRVKILGQNFKISLISFILFLNSCSSLFKPNLYLLDDKFETLQRDNLFLIAVAQNKTALFEDKEISKYEEKFKNLNSSSNLNLYSIYALKTGNIELAENTWWSLLEKNELSSFFNLLRTFYLLDDRDGIKKLLEKFFQKKIFSFSSLNLIAEVLISQSRFEELIWILDYVSNNIPLEILERLQIANYYLDYGELEKARKEFEKVLFVYSFQKEALEGMVKIYFYENNYETSNMFLKAYLNSYKPNEEMVLIGMENFYKLTLYREGLELSKQLSNPKNKARYFSLLKALYYSFSSKIPKTNWYSLEEFKTFKAILKGE